MKPIHFALLVSGLAAGLVLPACSPRPASAAAKAENVAYYTCTMHPSVRSQDPDGKCPICGMDLVPVARAAAAGQSVAANVSAPATDAAAGAPHDFTIAPERQQLIGVTYALVEKTPLRRAIRTVGLVAATAEKHWDYVARVEGYVHQHNIAAPGDRVEKGQVLMDLYSPDLVATENEYADLLRMRDRGQREHNAASMDTATHLLAGARARLRQWSVSDEQIDAIEKTGAAEYLPLISPFRGVVQEVAVHQGRHIVAGDHLVDLVDLSTVWVWAEFYENELPLLHPGLPVEITTPGSPGSPLLATISALDPFLDPVKRTGRVRINVDNHEGRLRPDAFVDVALALDEGEGLTVPVEAVLPTGGHNLVFVDHGAGRLEPRYIQLGEEFGERYQVIGGLQAGDRVVRSANFLVDAEAKVQGALPSQ